MKLPSCFALLPLLLAGAWAMQAELDENFVAVEQTDRRLMRHLEGGYNTTLLHREMCIGTTGEECEQMDTMFAEQIGRRNLQQYPLYNPSTGSIKVLVIFIYFKDHRNRVRPPMSDYDILFNSREPDSSIAPTGSVYDYFRKNSRGKLDLDFHMSPVGWVEAADTETSCADGNRGRTRYFQQCFKPALERLEELHKDPSSDFNWYDFDTDFDGEIDSLVVVHSGYGAALGGRDEDGTPQDGRIQSHATSTAIPKAFTSAETRIQTGNHIVITGYRGTDGQRIARLNIAIHEFTHTFGIPDLYDIDGVGYGAGGFDSMAFPYGHTMTLAGSQTPGHFSSWTKTQLGWMNPVEIVSDGTYSGGNLFETYDAYKISSTFPNNQYILIEFRPSIFWDVKNNGGGIVIWCINNNIQANTRNGYQFSVIQADGKLDLENKVNRGDAGDFWTSGKVFNRNSPRRYCPSDVVLDEFTTSGDNFFSFRVTGLPTTTTAEPTVQLATPVPNSGITDPPAITSPTVPTPVVPPTVPPPTAPGGSPTAPSSPSTPTNGSPSTPTSGSPSTPTNGSGGSPGESPTAPSSPSTPTNGSGGNPGESPTAPSSPSTPTNGSGGNPGESPTAPSSPSTPTNGSGGSPGESPTAPSSPSTPTNGSPSTPTNGSGGNPGESPTAPSSPSTPTSGGGEGPGSGPTSGGGGQCLVTALPELCEARMATIDIDEDCDCYNFCETQYIGCCNYGTACPLTCASGLVAGCEVKNPTASPTTSEPTPAPTPEPTALPTRQPTPDPTPQPSPRPSPVPTRETPEPSRAPQAPPPTANPPGGQCIVNVSLEQCPPLMQSQEIIEGCDCYNFCNGGSIACCQFGEACSIDCTGALVAGCTEPEPTPAPVSTGQCTVVASPNDCPPLVENQTPVENCDCYDYCDGQYIGCCAFGAFCGMICDGYAVAGCQLEGGPSPDPGNIPTAAPPTPASRAPFFFWPGYVQAPKKPGGEA